MGNPRITNQDIIWAFEKAAAVHTILGGTIFQIRAYQNAIETIQNLDLELSQLVAEHKLEGLPGIGTELRQKIVDMVTTGQSPALEQLYSRVPQAVFVLMKVPGIGPKKAYHLAAEFSIHR
jgi:DNA polymerase (family X)